MTLDETTRYLHAHIPITRQIGAEVRAYGGKSIRLAAPLAPNSNHWNAAFGGSLSALAILSGWALVSLALRDRGIDARVVIRRSEMDFDAPVTGELVVSSTLPPAAEWERFLSTFTRRGLARVHVHGAVGASGGRSGTHAAAYAALRHEPAAERHASRR